MTKHTFLTILVAAAWLGKGLFDLVVAKDQAAILVDFGGFLSTIGVQSIFSPPPPK